MNSHEPQDDLIRRWRKVFTYLYFMFTGAVVVWAIASLLVVNCGGRPVPMKGPRIRAGADDPKELTSCLKQLNTLLEDLQEDTFKLQAMALKSGSDPATEWKNWSRSWRFRWSALDWRCRLSDLSGKEVSPAVDAMAEIHEQLDELQLSYSGVVDRFVEQYIGRLRNLHKDLEQVQKLIHLRDPAETRKERSER